MGGSALGGEPLFHRTDPWGDEVSAIVVCASAEHVAVDDAGFVHVDASADLEVELAFRDGGHLEAVDDACACRDLDAVANACHGETLFPEPAGDAEEVLVFADVFRGASAAEEDADVVGGVDVFEGDVGFDGVAFPFFGDGPTGFDLVEDHLVAAFFGGGDDGLESGFDDAVEGVEGVDGFGCVADDDEDFGFVHWVIFWVFERDSRRAAEKGGESGEVTGLRQGCHGYVTAGFEVFGVITSDLTREASECGEPAVGSRIFQRRSMGSGAYVVRMASTDEDVRAAQTLRFLVFNLEMQEGLDCSYLTLRDEDRFDGVCDHLLVEHQGEVVGTYRMQTGREALLGHGLYSAQEFDLSPFESLRDELMELGRACVRRDHRNLIVLSLLWRGVVGRALALGCRYLVGCSSLNSREAWEGMAVYRRLALRHLAPEPFRTSPLAGWECSAGGTGSMEVEIPKLLRAYLSLGAWICGEPALDREFGTIDFLTLMDLRNLRGVYWEGGRNEH